MRLGMIAPLGGTFDSFFQEIIEAWQQEGHKVFLLSGRPARNLNVQVEPTITRRPSLVNAGAPAVIGRWAQENALDIILPSTATGAALPRIRKQRVPVVYFCHGLHWNTGKLPFEQLWKAVERTLLKNTCAVICMNSDDLQWFRDHFANDRLLYLENGVGVPLNQYQPSRLPETDVLQLLWAGEFSARKRPQLMLEVANILSKRGVRFQLTMLGQGVLYQEIQAQSQQLGLGDVVTMPGHQPIQEFIKNCHLFVHTALWEGLPRVMLEARAMQRQSVAFDTKGSRDIPDVIVAEDGNAADFADKVAFYGAQTLNGSHVLPPVLPAMDSAVVAQMISSFLEEILTHQNNQSR